MKKIIENRETRRKEEGRKKGFLMYVIIALGVIIYFPCRISSLVKLVGT